VANEIGQYQEMSTQQERCLTFLKQAVDESVDFDRLRALIEGARSIHTSAFHRLQQELVLGSSTVESIYGLEAWWDHPGYLQQIDLPLLSPHVKDNLLSMCDRDEAGIAILTNRPSTPPDGFFDTPEAEIGLGLLGLEKLPAVGAGVMGWLADRHGHSTNHYLKPSPVHALTALLTALGIPLEVAAEQASCLVEGSPDLQVWLEFDRRPVYVFEDASHGLLSLARATELLGQYGIRPEMVLVGIAEDRRKAEALKRHGAKVYERVDQALKDLELL
jgi:hypothetical protein